MTVALLALWVTTMLMSAVLGGCVGLKALYLTIPMGMSLGAVTGELL